MLIVGLLLTVALFLLVFGAVFAFQQALERDAMWGLVVSVLLAGASVSVFVFTAMFVDLLLCIILVLFTISKFGLEQSQHEALMREEVLEARRQLLRDIRVLDWYEAIRDHFVEQAESTAIGRFMAIRISDTFLGAMWQGMAKHMEFGPGIFGRMARAVTGLRGQAEGSLFLKVVSRISSVLVIFFAIGRIIYVAGGWDTVAGYQQILTQAETASVDAEWCCGKVVGERLARQFAGSKAMLIVKGPSSTGGEEDDELLRALQEALDGKVDIVLIEQVPRPSQPEISLAGSELSIQPAKEIEYNNARFLDGLVDAHPECSLVISTAGFPRDFRDMALWKKPKSECPHIVLINADISGLQPAIEHGVITAVVNNLRQRGERKPARTDPAATFDEYFLLINSENVSTLAEEYTRLFGGR